MSSDVAGENHGTKWWFSQCMEHLKYLEIACCHADSETTYLPILPYSPHQCWGCWHILGFSQKCFFVCSLVNMDFLDHETSGALSWVATVVISHGFKLKPCPIEFVFFPYSKWTVFSSSHFDMLWFDLRSSVRSSIRSHRSQQQDFR